MDFSVYKMRTCMKKRIVEGRSQKVVGVDVDPTSFGIDEMLPEMFGTI